MNELQLATSTKQTFTLGILSNLGISFLRHFPIIGISGDSLIWAQTDFATKHTKIISKLQKEDL